MFLKNNRPTLLSLPDHTDPMKPGEEREVTEEQAEALKKHPAMTIWLRAKFLTLSDERGEVAPPPMTSDEKTEQARRALIKQTKLQNIARMTSADALTAMANNENDADILEALNKRASALVEGSAGAPQTPPGLPPGMANLLQQK